MDGCTFSISPNVITSHRSLNLTAASERERWGRERAKREPVFFGAQYFLVLLGVVSVARYLSAEFFDGVNQGLAGRDLVTAAVAAVLFTLLMRWMAGRSA